MPLRRSSIVIFCLLSALALGWTIYTRHTWEDYYITFRASLNLASGHGLTYTAGERVHSFTSPLGVLLPALASLLTGNSSPDAALWLFRLMCISAYAGTGVLLWHLGTVLLKDRRITGGLVALVALDTKTVDFSTNGMETGFMLLFLVWFLWALFTSPASCSRHLGLAWAGLMWTRPDSFIYIGVLVLVTLLFRPSTTPGESRSEQITLWLKAGLLCTALYLPWLLWAWGYYGSPVPHTVIAKGLGPARDFSEYAAWIVEFPSRIAAGTSSFATTFLPPYGAATGWPLVAIGSSALLAFVAAFAWLLPFLRWPARVASLVFLLTHFYLTFFPNYPFPWYIPPTTLLALLTFGIIADQLLEISGLLQANPAATALAGSLRRTVLIGGCGLLLGSVTLTAMAACQLKWQQQIVEEGLRRKVGEWLKVNAATPADTVFLEPLGYIGFYSGLKMYDWPGLSSLEVVAARRKIVTPFFGPDYWPELIRELQPDWLVLREKEAIILRRRDPQLLSTLYQQRQRFDVRKEIYKHPDLPGIAYLFNDECYEVYAKSADVTVRGRHRPANGLRPLTLNSFYSKTAQGEIRELSDPVPQLIFAHAPSRLVAAVPAQARRLSGKFGFMPGALTDSTGSTDGAEFKIELVNYEGQRRTLLSRRLDPLGHAADHVPQAFNVEIPSTAGNRVEFSISNGGADSTDSFDWTYWGELNWETGNPPAP